MTKKFIFIIALTACLFLNSDAQDISITSGTIVYERRFNVHAIIDPEQGWSKSYKENEPQFMIDQFKLDFNTTQSKYYNEIKRTSTNFFVSLPAQNNSVYKNMSTREMTSSKQVFNTEFLIKDSIPSIQWFITNEFREIAGIECRRANAVIFDSIYVVGFFSPQIPISSGPESLGGLPGMILGLAIPSMNTTWFATKVSGHPIQLTNNESNKKSSPLNNQQFLGMIRDKFRDHGRFERRFLLSAIL